MTVSIVEAVQRLQLAYVRAIDDDRLEEWPDFFADTCLYRVTHRADYDAGRQFAMIYADSQGMLADRVSSLRSVNIYEAQSYRHMINPPWLVDDAPDLARVGAQTGFLIARIMRTGELSLFASGCYIDRIDLSGSTPKFVEKTVVLDSPVIDTLLALPF